MTPKTFTIPGYDYLEKIVKAQSDTSSKVYLPAVWVDKKVAVILLEDITVSQP